VTAKKKRRSKRKPAERNCRVYVINLKRTVLQSRKFMNENPDYVSSKPCVYVGSTSRTSQQRFEQHLRGIRSSWCPRRYGRSLRESECRPELLTRARAQKRERNLAKELRKRGWGVWSN
jgi:hypothetical protein